MERWIGNHYMSNSHEENEILSNKSLNRCVWGVAKPHLPFVKRLYDKVGRFPDRFGFPQIFSWVIYDQMQLSCWCQFLCHVVFIAHITLRGHLFKNILGNSFDHLFMNTNLTINHMITRCTTHLVNLNLAIPLTIVVYASASNTSYVSHQPSYHSHTHDIDSYNVKYIQMCRNLQCLHSVINSC